MEGWEGQIDVDDSDLQSVLRPPLISLFVRPTQYSTVQPCSQISSSFSNPRPYSLYPSFSIPTSYQYFWINQNEEEEHPSFPVPLALFRRPCAGDPLQLVQKGCSQKGKEVIDLDLCVNEEDGDFKLKPWLYALSFLGLGKDSNLPYPISLINAQRSGTQRIPQVEQILHLLVVKFQFSFICFTWLSDLMVRW
ncbi:hypothetical protein MA16_Dca004478 [Dendrobium catenatum]|uniref:Uncharacterized protein n=1 Tax=Dendrobium catenatum TaxID=906689 RepID=A0A2I0W7K0_9ASPA|nr:hypothetical protein MA16_Dca004478 [Dendrobium catenatum]